MKRDRQRDRPSFLFALAGARQEVLAKCPTERIKFQSLGLGILITSGIATLSMWFALHDAMGVNAIVALLLAVVWGFIIMGIDRWLVASMPTTGRRRWTIAVPRLVLALLLGSLISTPIVLRIFQSEINAQIVLIKQQRENAFLAAQQSSKVGQQVAYWTKDVDNLQKVILSGGAAPLNRSTDPVIAGLTKQRAAEVKLQQHYYQQWQCQLYGGKGCTVKGNGPLAGAMHRSYEQAAAQVAGLATQIRNRDRQLTASDSASKKVRLQQAQAALPAARAQQAAATAREDALQEKYDTSNLATNGLLIRLQALSQLAGQNFTIKIVQFLLFLFFLVIEILPVTVKLMQQPGIYEKILQDTADHELREARRSLRFGARPSATPDPVRDAPVATMADLHELWQQPAREPSSRPRSATARASHEEPTRTAEQVRLDDQALRVMPEMREATIASEPDWPGGGIDLHYGDHDL